MFAALTKFLIAIILSAYLAGGGSVCIHEVASWFAGDCHHCDGHHHDEGPEDDENPCDCDVDGFTGAVPALLLLDGPGEFFQFTDGKHAIESSMLPMNDSRERWQHPPPLLVYGTSLPSLQRFNV